MAVQAAAEIVELESGQLAGHLGQAAASVEQREDTVPQDGDRDSLDACGQRVGAEEDGFLAQRHDVDPWREPIERLPLLGHLL
jgi:hypothetical protein